jgi:hypothetical protein
MESDILQTAGIGGTDKCVSCNRHFTQLMFVLLSAIFRFHTNDTKKETDWVLWVDQWVIKLDPLENS